MNDKNLGRGLSAFLNGGEPAGNGDKILKINVDAIRPNPFQPRRTFNEESINHLAESIKKKGVFQPILVIKIDGDSYQLVAGERRLRAAKIAGMMEIPAILTEAGEKDQLEMAILENIQREDLNPLDEAAAYKRLMDEFNHTQEELSEILGKSRSHVANMLRLLTLPNEVQNMVKDEKLSFGHARAIIGTEDAVYIANQVVSQSLNVRQVEDLVKQRKNRPSENNERFADPEILNLSNQISSIVGLKSNIKLKGKGGIIEINFNTFEELDQLVHRLNG
ncbi:MAG: ParB/RepB/Spo0J family partition protein [Holosporaceae bacterium]|jgi:ParB family chromosome partitioning protein|nr:ParB/RepB/Spo0J family partition protein [Holosporaceae bacterium]